MKKILTLPALLIAAFAPAQITITKSDMPDTGDNIVVSMTGNFSNANPATTGPNHTWNFSFLSPDSQKVDSFVAVTSTPFAYQFYFNNIVMYPNHKASYASPVFTPNFIPQFTVEDVYDFYKELTTEYSYVGFGAKINSVPASVKYDSIDVIYNFPVDYGNSDSCWSKFGFSVPNYGYYGQERHRVNTVDGWGTLITPYGSFQALRVKSVIEATDTVYNASFGFGFTTPRPTQVEYKWLGQGSKIPLLQVNTQINFSNEVITGIFYKDSLRNTSIAETGLSDILFSVYPNPAQEAAIIAYIADEPADVRIEALDITGRLVRQIKNGTVDQGAHSAHFDVRGLPPGVYLIRIAIKGSAAYSKLVIQ
jgi:hypothetical protein